MTTVYHVSPLRLWLPTGAFGAGGILLLVSAQLTDDAVMQNALFLTAIFLLVCTCVIYLSVRFARLELTESGVKLRQIGYTLETTWDNIEKLYDARRAEGLVLRRPMDASGAGVLRAFRSTGVGAGIRMYNTEQIQWLAEQRFIPIDAFAYWLDRGDLRAQLTGAISRRGA